MQGIQIREQVPSCDRRLIGVFLVPPRARQVTYGEPRLLGLAAAPDVRYQ